MARVALLCAFATTVAGNAVELTPDNFDKEILQSGKSALIKFLAPW
jgi:protein disulfide-isomerase A6